MKASDETALPERTHHCPKCKKPLRRIKGKMGPFGAAQDFRIAPIHSMMLLASLQQISMSNSAAPFVLAGWLKRLKVTKAIGFAMVIQKDAR